jgi:hypothetical protein
MVHVFGLLLVAGCSQDVGDPGEGTILSATPTQLFLEVGESKTVDVSAKDNDGNPVTAEFVVTDPGSGIGVRRDSTFLPVYVDDSTLQVPPTAERFRFIVTADAYTSTHFTVTANGKTIDIPVQVVPTTTLEATISNPAPALGETIRITAPAGTHFNATSTVTVPGAAAQPFLVALDPAGAFADVILPPNLVESALTLTDISADATPELTYDPATSATVTTTAIPSFTGTTSNLAPAVNEPVTVTLTDATIAPDATLLLGAGAPTITNLTTNAVTFIPAPGTSAQLVINGVVLNALPQIPLSLPAPETDTIKVAADVPEVPGTDAAGTAPSLLVPAVGLNSVLFDNPATFGAEAFGFPTRFYKVTLTEETTLTVTMEWGSGEDLGGYWFADDGTTDLPFDPADAHGEGATASPETVTNTMPAGNYILAVLNFSATNPPTMNITLTNEPPAAAVKRLASSKAAPRKLRK